MNIAVSFLVSTHLICNSANVFRWNNFCGQMFLRRGTPWRLWLRSFHIIYVMYIQKVFSSDLYIIFSFPMKRPYGRRHFDNTCFILWAHGIMLAVNYCWSRYVKYWDHLCPSSLKFIRLLRVVFSSQVTEGVITTRSNRMKFRLVCKPSGCSCFPFRNIFFIMSAVARISKS